MPILEYVIRENKLRYRWGNCIKGFDMPLKIYFDKTSKLLNPTTRWQQLEIPVSFSKFFIDPNFYIASFNLTGETNR